MAWVGPGQSTGRAARVTNFHRDANLYQMNAHLDRNIDGIACEKR